MPRALRAVCRGGTVIGVVVSLELAAEGRVVAAEIFGLDLVDECIRKTVLGWSFPLAKQATSITAIFQLGNDVAAKAPAPRCPK